MSDYGFTNEKNLTNAVVRAVKETYPDVWVLKVHGGGYQSAGVPDLLFCVAGKLIAVEMKHKKPGESIERLYKRVSPRQAAEIDKIQRAGGSAIVAWEVGQVLDAVQELAKDY